jgi:ribosomal protein S6
MNSQYYTAELNNIFNQLKNKSTSVQDAGTKQLNYFFNKNRENSDEIISKISQFFNVNSDIPDRLMIKVINTVVKILTENNAQIINFLNLIFPLLFHIVFYSNRNIE